MHDVSARLNSSGVMGIYRTTESYISMLVGPMASMLGRLSIHSGDTSLLAFFV